jgi:hypothetical protein
MKLIMQNKLNTGLFYSHSSQINQVFMCLGTIFTHISRVNIQKLLHFVKTAILFYCNIAVLFYNTVKQKFIQMYIFCYRFVTAVIYFCRIKTMKITLINNNFVEKCTRN